MRLISYRSIAAISIAVLLIPGKAARRPSYGGTLRVETSTSIASPDGAFAGLVFETLVQLDEHGRPRPWLATSWMHDVPRKRWVFTPRANVILHNGAHWEPSPDSLIFPDDRPIDRILADLARPRNAIVVHTPDGALAGTGPFSLARFDTGKSASLAAHVAYWGGRPYLDSIEVLMGQSLRQQALDLELGKADAVEIDLSSLRRLRQQNANVVVSTPNEVLALVFDGPTVPAPAQEAVADSVDRSAMQNVLLQRQGQISGALLPQWLSGYSFVFPTARNLSKARQLSAGAAPMTVAYDRDDALARAIAERMAVNAGEAGLMVRASPEPSANAHVVRLHITSLDPRNALEDLSDQLKTPLTSTDNLYDTERALIAASHVIPLVHIPQTWQLSPKVHNWTSLWQVEDVWLEP